MDIIKPFLSTQPTLDRPTWLVIGAPVKLCGWCGRVTEIAVSHRAIYIRVFGAKSIYHGNIGGDLVEYSPSMVELITDDELNKNNQLYITREELKLEQMRKL